MTATPNDTGIHERLDTDVVAYLNGQPRNTRGMTDGGDL